jgi:mycothiol system anti-sigma-R factor
LEEKLPEDPCSDALHELYHFLDGEVLTEDARRHIAQHLEECPPCGEKYNFEAELKLLIRSRCRDAVPESLRIRIATAIDHERLHPDASA